MKREDLIDELTLALIHLTSWEEKDGFDGTVRRAWKSYDWDAIDRLSEQGLVSTSHRSKSVYLTERGVKVAKATAKAYEASIDAFYDYVGEVVRSTRSISNEPAFEFRVTLELGGPLICWRQIVVPKDFTFAEFHEVIQSAFLWWDYHLYDFRLRSHGENLEILDPDQGGVDAMFAFDDGQSKQVDATQLRLSDVFPRTRTASYSYDYGDGWEHRIKLVRTIDTYEGEMPACTDGEGDAPPEDVGGPGGFWHFLRVINDETDPEHDDLMAWGKGLFFEHFSLDAVNRRMREWRSGELFRKWDEANGDGA